ncbi:MAG: DUF4215 domain-containing protein [Myxococcota bacterium]
MNPDWRSARRGNRMGWSIALVLAPLTVLGCSTGVDSRGDYLVPGPSNDDGESADSWPDDGPPLPPPGSGSGDDCAVGTIDCPCAAGIGCDPGLVCDFGQCIALEGWCGDGLVDDDEECDDGLANADDAQCKSDCRAQRCGDDSVGPGEACDDGNEIDDDGCNNQCAADSCGDGDIQQGEECDDENDDDSDECLSTCLMAKCGDAAVREGTEECDDGNANDADGCTQTCECRLTFEDGAHIDGWELTGDWEIYDEAPPSDWPAVSFAMTQGRVLGTDGNRMAPYPGAEPETSSATTASFTLPSTLRFRSWHVDEGGQPDGEGLINDTKRIGVSVDGGDTWQTLVDCTGGPGVDLPFCQGHQGPRDAGDWDEIQLDTTAFAGMPGMLRFEYDTLSDSCCGLEQGWFIDDLNGFGCE